LRAVFEKTCATTQTNVKSHVFLDLKNVKNVRSLQFQRPLNHSGHPITQLPKVSTDKSPTSNILLRNADVVFTFTRNYAS